MGGKDMDNNEKIGTFGLLGGKIIDEPVPEAPRKRNSSTKSIAATVNFVKGGRTSVSYNNNGETCGMYIPGNFHGNVEILYAGSLSKDSIKEIIQK